MNLYLVRHGEATGGDADPGLSARGINSVWRIAAFLRDRVAVEPREILHSTKRRARETAEILSEAIGPERPVREMPGLTPHDPPEAVEAALRREEDDLVLVSHLPLLERLVSRLLNGHENGENLEIPPGTVVALGRRGAGFFLRFLVSPDLLAER